MSSSSSSSTGKTKQQKEKTTGKAKAETNAEFLNYCALSHVEMKALANGTDAIRAAARIPVNDERVTTSTVTRIQPMNPLAQLVTMLFLAFGVPNGVFTLPVVLFVIGKFVFHNVKITFGVATALLLPLAILPQPFVPSTLTSWMACQVIKYFSFRFIAETSLGTTTSPTTTSTTTTTTTTTRNAKDNNSSSQRKERQQLYIFVAPPHGVFPYGNILSMLIFPALHGFAFNGLAASSALRVPVFKQILSSIGVIDASRVVAQHALAVRGKSIGISTGGVREVFETNEEHECILLRERKGLIKLAIRTGADLVPCYMFGNTKALGCWTGQLPGPFGGGHGEGSLRNWLESISRKVGFALVLIYGRYGLPIPFRIPILGVHGKPIPTKQFVVATPDGNDTIEPTSEQIDAIQRVLLQEMQELYERYKGLYGWKDTELIIK